MRDPHTLSPTSMLVAWPNGNQDHSAHARLAGKLGLETNRAPLPPAAVGRARIAQPGPVSKCPQTYPQVRAAGPPAPGFPCSFNSPSKPIALPRCFIPICFDLCHTQRLLSALPPLQRYIDLVAVSPQEPKSRLMHVCARPL
jgi:hypothetical protein